MECIAPQCTFAGYRKYLKPVEKRTDVNLALHIVSDARVQKPDAICIISGDTDLIPAMELVRAYYPCKRFAFIPCKIEALKFRRVDEFEMHSWDTVRLKEEVVMNCRFADVWACTEGPEIKCPTLWL